MIYACTLFFGGSSHFKNLFVFYGLLRWRTGLSPSQSYYTYQSVSKLHVFEALSTDCEYNRGHEGLKQLNYEEYIWHNISEFASTQVIILAES